MTLDPRLEQRCRATYMAGAEAWSRQTRGRGRTPAELERVLRRYPGEKDAAKTRP